MLENLNNKTAFVVGGSSGIGAASVRSLAKAGACVAIGYKTNQLRAEELISELPGSGHFAVQIDIGNSTNVSSAIKRVSSKFTHLDILVNSGGTTQLIPHSDLHALSDEFFDEVMQVNTRGVFGTIRECQTLLQASSDAVVINISSVAGAIGLGSNVAYCASKAAVDTMTRSLARALAPKIRVMAVCPGVVATQFIPGVDQEKLREYGKREPLGKICEAEDVADAVIACVTHLRLSTGSHIFVDAGRMINQS